MRCEIRPAFGAYTLPPRVLLCVSSHLSDPRGGTQRHPKIHRPGVFWALNGWGHPQGTGRHFGPSSPPSLSHPLALFRILLKYFRSKIIHSN